jgi:hypothetical protein
VQLSLQPAELHGAPGSQTGVTLTADTGSTRLGAWTVDVGYDPSQLKVVGCQAASGGLCNPSFAAGVVRIVGASASGLSGKQTLATLTFEGVGHGKPSPLSVTAVSLADTSGAVLKAAVAAPAATSSPTPVPSAPPAPAATPGPGGPRRGG